mgnify:CR=1 FL=1
MVTIPGVDYAWSHPGGAALAAAGMRFACRYLSHDAAKNLTRAEADDLAAHGVSCVVVWETTATRAGAGRAAGVADAQAAEQQARAAGMPSKPPIYFAVDYDAAPGAVVPYFQGVASVIGVGRTGVYGGYTVVKSLLDQGVARWAWQTAAWSQGRWDARAVIRQPATTVRINGVTCDNNTAHATDYGQWTPGRTPSIEEDDMQLNESVTLPAWVKSAWPADKGVADGRIAVQTALGSGYGHARRAAENTSAILAQVRTLTATVGSLTGALTALAKTGGLTANQVQAAAEAGARAALAELGDVLTTKEA